MELIHGSKPDEDDGPTPDDILDRDLSSPTFASWSTLREVKNLHHVIHLLPQFEQLRPVADQMLTCASIIDDGIEGWST